MSVPRHIISAAAIVLDENNQILLIKGPRRGWEIPGGQVEEGESIKDAVVREVKEETGIDVEVLNFCGIFQNVSDSICNTLWLARPVGGQIQTSEESLEVGYYPLDEALNMVSWKNFRERILHCLDKSKHPFFVAF